MNGYYQYDDPLTLTKVNQKFAYTSPCRSRAASQHENASKPPASAVWNVVSSLVQALSDARDDLLALLSSGGVRVARRSDGTTMTRRNNSSSRSPSMSPNRSLSRPFSAPTASDLRRSRSPTRSHAYSGRMSSPNSSDHQQKSRTKTNSAMTHNFSPPVSFGMNLHFDSVRRGRSPPAGYRRPAGRYQPMNMSPQRGITAHGLEYFPAVPVGQRSRHCHATRFADLLEAETYHLRQHRLAGEATVAAHRSKPSWY